MRKRSLIAAVIAGMCVVSTCTYPVCADGMKVVTLGADLTEEQKDVMLRYFKVDENEVEILSVTNADEREHLSAYVPLEQIGTRTVSCAYVKPTNSGGIKVRTANLNWVTCNMIASTLSTSGVTNCEVVAACPFEVSGTGALTGIIMAYETASGEELDETKKELATEELVVTGNLAQDMGQNDATNVINESKMEIIDSGIQSADEIYNVVVNVAQRNGIELDAEQLDRIVSLLEEIAQQNYDYEAMRETLENVEENLNEVPQDEETPEEPMEETPEDPETDPETDPEEEFVEDTVEEPEDADDSIIVGLDESILGDDVIAGSTEDPSLQEETAPEEEPLNEEDSLNVEDLSAEDRELFEEARQFCLGEFAEDMTSEQYNIKIDGPAAFVILTAEEAEEATEQLLSAFAEILRDDGASYVPEDTDEYLTAEMNMMKDALEEMFFLKGEEPTEGIWVNYTTEERVVLYNDALGFFEEMFGEVRPEDGDEVTTEPQIEEIPEEEQVEEPFDEQIEEIPEESPEEVPEDTPEDVPEEEAPEETLENPDDAGDSGVEIEVMPGIEGQEPTGEEWMWLDGTSPEEGSLNIDDLEDWQKELFEKAKEYCAGEFEGNEESVYYTLKADGPAADVVLNEDEGKKISQLVLEEFLEVLRDGGESYEPQEDDVYVSPEMNMLEDSLSELFVIDKDEEIMEGIWMNYNVDQRTALYDDTMAFFSTMLEEGEDALTPEE